jgi:hypothetical protein
MLLIRFFAYEVDVDGGLTLFSRTIRASLGKSLLMVVQLSMATVHTLLLSRKNTKSAPLQTEVSGIARH